jgi:hypothetical protein
MMPDTNYNSGSTVKVLGNLTANDMTLVNGPTWGASGLAFASASSQYGSIADFLGSETLTVFARMQLNDATPALPNMFFDQGAGLTDLSRRAYTNTTGDVQLQRSSAGTTGSREFANSAGAGTTEDITSVFQWVDGSGRNFWQNKTSKSLSVTSANTSAYNSSGPVFFACDLLLGSFFDGTAHALAFITGTLTTAQRETITDLINEL